MVTPEGLNGPAPFSFIVIGDTGEGDAGRRVLRDSLIPPRRPTMCHCRAVIR